MKENPPDKSLTVLLREWNVDAKPGPDFAAGVWRRIARRGAETPVATLNAGRARWWGVLNGRMDFAWGAAAALLITLGAGWLGHRSGTSQADSTPNDISYLASVDPYRMTP